MFEIKVPATSANLGIGFDCLGLAINIYNEFKFEVSDKFYYSGFKEEFCNDDNLVKKAYCKVFDKAKKDIIPVQISFNGDIPVKKGDNVYSSYKHIITSSPENLRFFKEPIFIWTNLPDDQATVIVTYIVGAILPICALLLTSMVTNQLNIDRFLKRVIKRKIHFIKVIPVSGMEINIILKYVDYLELVKYKSILYKISVIDEC